MRLPHDRELLEIIPLAELYTTYKDHERLTVFANKGRFCVACGREGTFIIISKETPSNKQSRRKKTVGRKHLDLYTDDFVLMTVDHIVPKAVANKLGWSKALRESLDNKQTMCDPCNNRKGSKSISNEELARRVQYTTHNQRRALKNADQGITGVEVLRTLVDNFHRLNGDYEIMAGKVGIEPTITESKSGALPVGHFPLRSQPS